MGPIGIIHGLGLSLASIFGMVNHFSNLDLNSKNSRKKLSRFIFGVKDNSKLCLSYRQVHTRHNYITVSNYGSYKEISCVKCGNIIGLYDFEDSVFAAKQAKLRILDSQKGTGDITIYRISWKKDKTLSTYLEFPGLCYSGQTLRTALERAWSHYLQSSYVSSTFARTLKQYKLTKNQFLRLFKVDILKIVRFQGDLSSINEIDNLYDKGIAMGLARERTQALADSVERFFIGFYKSQYPEFGRNYLEGGRFVAPTEKRIIDYEDLYKALDVSRHLFSRVNKPRENIINLLNSLKKYPFKITREILESNLDYYFQDNKITTLLEGMIIKDIVDLAKRYVNIIDIAKILNIRIQKIAKFSPQGIKRLLKKHFEDITGIRNADIKDIRRYLTSEFIEQLVKSGYSDIKSLHSEVWGYQSIDSLGAFIVRELGGIWNLVKKYKSTSSIPRFRIGVQLVKSYLARGESITKSKILFDLYDNYDEFKNIVRREALSKNSGYYFKRYFGITLDQLINFASTGKLFNF